MLPSACLNTIPVSAKLERIPTGMAADVIASASVYWFDGNHFFATMLCDITKKGEDAAISALPATT